MIRVIAPVAALLVSISLLLMGNGLQGALLVHALHFALRLAVLGREDQPLAGHYAAPACQAALTWPLSAVVTRRRPPSVW